MKLEGGDERKVERERVKQKVSETGREKQEKEGQRKGH